MSRKLDSFTRAYVTCALWSSTCDDETPMDERYVIFDISDETLEQMKSDCEKFQFENDIPEYGHNEYSDEEMAGHDFWLTRNRHGAGFGDRGFTEEVGKKLTDSAHAYGEFNLYVGDDGRVYGQ